VELDERDTVDGAKGSRAYTAAVAVILRDGVDDREVLTGKAVSEDDRNGQLCFPGGGEETGLEVMPISIIDHPEKPGVAFVVCHYGSGQPEPNQEFTSLQWLPVDAMKYGEYPDVYPQNRQILWRLDPRAH
jgi:8-oxo-dGTP pyrophosphatase MutT (NUDIX family)